MGRGRMGGGWGRMRGGCREDGGGCGEDGEGCREDVMRRLIRASDRELTFSVLCRSLCI